MRFDRTRRMFGLPSLQIYGIQNEPNGTKVTTQFLEKFIKSELINGSAEIRNGLTNDNNCKNNTNSNNSCRKQNVSDCDEKLLPNVADQLITFANSERNSNDEIPETLGDNLTKRLCSAESNLDMQRKKYMKVISFLTQHNQFLEVELAKEKRRRADELSKIIKSLLCFEAKLKLDRKVINQQLYEKDTEICKLMRLNKVLTRKLGSNCNNSIEEYIGNEVRQIEDALQCSSCRKEFYSNEGTDVWTQTFTGDGSMKDDHTEYASSSDETLSSSFCGARRSIRYTSKRTFGTFRDYMRSRSMSIDDPHGDNSEGNASTVSREDSQNSYEKMNCLSSKIERLHGIKTLDSFGDDGGLESGNESRRGNSCEDGEYQDEEVFMPIKTSRPRIREFAETSPKQDFETSTDDWYASASDVEDSESVRVKPYGYNAVNPVLECVNQILLQQSMDELMDGPASIDSSENNSGSMGSNKDTSASRKRVHFSTKNSMVHVPRSHSPSLDNESKDNSFNYESIYSNEYEPIGSEQNSSNLYVDMESKLGPEDRHATQEKSRQPPALPPKPANLMKFKRVLRLSPQIRNDSKASDRAESEPDYCSISEVNEAVTSVQIVADVHKSADDDISSSASIKSETASSQKTDDVEEIFADIPKLPNVAAIIAPKAINRFISTDNYITKSPTKEAEADTGSETATTMTCMTPSKQVAVPNILAEINKKIIPTSPTTPTSPTKPHGMHPILSPSKIKLLPEDSIKLVADDKLALQEEFDWYNLDAEYGKSNQPDVIKKDVNQTELNSDGMSPDDENDEDDPGGHHPLGVEYNLDEEFSLVSQPDIIKENILEPKTCSSTPPSKMKTVCEGFPTIVDHTPCNQKAKVKGAFVNFIEGSGLSSKPLPRQRKIYFSGPFV